MFLNRSFLSNKSASILVSEEARVAIHVATCGHSEDQILILGVLLGYAGVLGEHVLVLAFEQGVSVHLPGQVLPELFVCLDELFDGPLPLVEVDFLHLVAVDQLLEVVDLLSQGLLRGHLVLLACSFGALLSQNLALDFLFLDDSLERLDKHLKFSDALASLSPQADGLLLLLVVLG